MMDGLYVRLSKMPHEALFELAKKLGVFDGLIAFGRCDNDHLYFDLRIRGVVRRAEAGKHELQWRKNRDEMGDDFDMVSSEIRSRLAAYPHLLWYANTKGYTLKGGEYYDGCDFRLFAPDGSVADEVEVKCRVEEKTAKGVITYDMAYFYKDEHPIYLNENKQGTATLYYTQTRDGYGLLFRISENDGIKPITVPLTNEIKTNQTITKNVILFNCVTRKPIAYWTPWCVDSKKMLGL